MNQPVVPPSPGDQTGIDSLSADIVLADDRGGTTVLPADPDALAQFLEERRQLRRDSAAEKDKPQ
jgi:hypothetical protein